MSTPYGPVSQLAWVTGDLEATEAALGRVFGVRAWTRLPDIAFGPADCTWRGEPADFVADISLAYAGDLQLEIIRPARGASLYAEFLEATGGAGGLHHVCCEVADLAAVLARVAAEDPDGTAVVAQGSMAGGLIRFAYLEVAGAGASGTSLIELAQIAPDLQAMYDDVRRRSAGGTTPVTGG